MAIITGNWSASVGSVASEVASAAGSDSKQPVSMTEIVATLGENGVANLLSPGISGFVQSFELLTVGTALGGTITLNVTSDIGGSIYAKTSINPASAQKVGADSDFTTRDVCGRLAVEIESSSAEVDAGKTIKLRIYASRSKG